MRWRSLAVAFAAIALASCAEGPPPDTQPDADHGRSHQPEVQVTLTPAAPLGIASSGLSTAPAPRSPFPELDVLEGERDFRDLLPVGSPFDARDYVDALEKDGGRVSFRGLVFNLCRVGSPQAARIDFLDDLDETRELLIWTYQSVDEVQHDWSFEQLAERRVVPRDTGCPTGALLAERVAGAAWAFENLVVAIPTASLLGTANGEKLLSVLESLSEHDGREPGDNP
jgi:hypothetical protein